MNAAGIAGLIRRRGSIVQWYHAIPASGNRVDPLTKQPILQAGGPRKPMGPTGETYYDPVNLRAYWSKKVSDVFLKQYGVVDQSDSQLNIAIPFAPEPLQQIQILDPDLLAAFNNGDFVHLAKDDTLLARDKFKIGGAHWVVKARAIPIVDANRTVAFRLLIGKMTL